MPRIRFRWMFLSFLVVYALTPLASAESIVWSNNTVPDLIAIGSDGADRATVSMFNVGVTVQYHATPWLVDDAGTKVRPLASGEQLMIGDRVLFEFSSHVREDISWFGQGGAYDTPYGTWFNGIVPESVTDPALAPTLIFEWLSNTVAQGKYAANDKGGVDANSVALSIGQPAKSAVVSGAGAQCMPQGNNQLCTFTTTGNVTGQFEFATTKGEFFAAWADTKKKWAPKRAPEAMTLRADFRKSAGDFDLTVPMQTIPFTFTISDIPANPETHTPQTPSLTSGGACLIGSPHTVTFTSTDPDGDNLRYGIDWNADGSIDQWVPPSGYVASGSTQSASRTYATEGTKTVNVLAQDEGGLTSAWATTSFTCAPSVVVGLEGEGSGSGTGGSGSSLPPTPTLDLRVVPSLVRHGDTTTVNWSADNVQSCTVTAPNGDAWSGLVSPIGGETSSPITTQTIYTLSCIDLNDGTQTKRVTVDILPVFQEI